MPTPKNSLPKTIARDHPARLFLSVIIIFVAISSGLGFYYERREPQAQQPPSRATIDTAYKSLDLSVARQATFTAPAIRIAKDYGIKDKVRQRLINFDVPKDGLSEYGLMTTPLGKPPKGGWPVLVLGHGYVRPSDYSTRRDYLPDMEFYSLHGYAVIKPDFRGQGASIHQGTPDGAFYSMSYNTDVLSLIAAIKQTDYLNRSDINIWGHSMGGYIALRAAVLSPDIKRVILLSAPVGSLKDMFKLYTPISDKDNIVARRIRQSELTAHGTPLSNPSYWGRTSPLNYLDDMRGYTLIYVGRNDRIVPPKFSADLDSALAAKHKLHKYSLYTRGSHGLLPQRPLIWESSLKELQKTPLEP